MTEHIPQALRQKQDYTTVRDNQQQLASLLESEDE